MSRRWAHIGFGAFFLAATAAMVYLAAETIQLYRALARESETIRFDSGLYYVLLASVFWLGAWMEIHGRINPKAFVIRYGSQVAVAWFTISLALAHVIPYIIVRHLESAGYIRCAVVEDTQHVGDRGERMIWVKSRQSCQGAELPPGLSLSKD